MAISPLAIQIAASGGNAVVRSFQQIAAGAKQVQTAMAGISDEGAAAAKAAATQERAWASTWSKSISAAKQFQTEQRRIAQQQQAVNKGAASSWTPYISALRKADASQRQLADESKRFAQQQQAVNKGAASSWTPYISSLRAVRQEQQKLADEQKQLAAQMAARQTPINGAGAASSWNPYASAQGQQQLQQQKYAAMQNAGMVMSGLGVGGGALAWKAAENAGRVEKIKMGFSTSLNGDQKRVDDLYAAVEDFDKRSSFSFAESADAAQLMLSMDMSDKEIPGMMDALGNLVAAGGGGTTEFQRAALQIGQVKSQGYMTNEDARTLTQGARLPMNAIIKSTVGEERYKKWRKGKETITSDEILPGLEQWAKKNRGNGMENALNTLPGQLDALRGEFFKFSVMVGQDLMPVLKLGVSLIRALTGALAMLPAPFRKVLVLVAALGVAFLSVVGIGVTLLGTLGMATIGMSALGISVGATGTAAGATTLSLGATTGALTGLAGTLGVVLLPAIAAIALAATAAAATILAIKWTKEAATKSDEEMEGPNSSLRQRAVSKAGRFLGNWTVPDEIARGDKAEQESAALFSKLRKKAPYRPSAAATTNAVKAAAAASGANPQAIPSTAVGAAATYTGGLGSSVGSIDSLSERLMLSDDKDEKKTLKRELFYARRNERYRKAGERERKAMEREAKREENARKREAKHEEVEARKAARAKHALQERIENSLSAQEIAQLKAQTDVRIAALQAQKRRGKGSQGQNAAIDYQISLLRAEETEKAAAIKASHDDRFAEFGGQGIAGMRAQALRQGAQFKLNGALSNVPTGNSVSGIMAELRNGQSIFDISRRRKNQAIDFGGASTSGSGVSRETLPSSIDVPLHSSQSLDANGDIVVNFHADPLTIRNDWRRAAGGR